MYIIPWFCPPARLNDNNELQNTSHIIPLVPHSSREVGRFYRPSPQKMLRNLYRSHFLQRLFTSHNRPAEHAPGGGKMRLLDYVPAADESQAHVLQGSSRVPALPHARASKETSWHSAHLPACCHQTGKSIQGRRDWLKIGTFGHFISFLPKKWTKICIYAKFFVSLQSI